MPREARLDAPGVLHHVTVRGIEQREIFGSDDDRADFVRRLASLLPETETACLAWSLLPNQLDLAVRSGPRGLAHLMRRLLTGYAVAFNRRHGRAGHLFQNRYRSVVCEEERYLLPLVRYVHLRPVRAGIVSESHTLAEYPWCGHGALVGRFENPWQAVAEVLSRFGEPLERAREAYAAFVGAELGADEEPRQRTQTAERLAAEALAGQPESPQSVAASQRAWGSPEFVDALRARSGRAPQRSDVTCQSVVEAVCRVLGLSPHALASGRRTRPLSNGRALVVYVARTRYRIGGAALAEALGVSAPAVTFAERRGAQLLKRRLDLRTSLREFLEWQ